jgi:hypothetical protein
MGYYFPRAKTAADLNPEQRERYEMLRSSETEQPPPALKARFESIKKRIGPITSGDIWAAFDELWQDAITCWILSGENPKIEWVDLHTEERKPAEEERRRAQKWTEEFLRKLEEDQKCRERELEEWAKINYPVRYFLWTLAEKLLNKLNRLRK